LAAELSNRARAQVPGGDGQALQDEISSLIMPMIYNLTNNTNGSCME